MFIMVHEKERQIYTIKDFFLLGSYIGNDRLCPVQVQAIISNHTIIQLHYVK